MTPLENYLRLLKSLTNELACFGQEIPGEAKKWPEDVIDATENDGFLSENENTVLPENTNQARNHLYKYNFSPCSHIHWELH